MPSRSELQIKSYAKINWTLDVLFKREDGYHELRTIYQTVSLHDSLRISASDDIEVTSNDPRVPNDDTNLAFKAAMLLRKASGSSRGARIEIEKRIPVAAGLGGGSSNAAVTLLALVRLWELDIDAASLNRIAEELGSDVPFFLVGGTALGTGRGEVVEPIEQVHRENLVLVNPGFPVSTRDAYEKLPQLTTPEAASIIPLNLPAANGIRELPLVARNDLEDVVVAAHPEIAEVKRRLISLGARHALMSGSGATVFGVFDNSELAARAVSDARASGYWAERARTIGRDEYQDSIFE